MIKGIKDHAWRPTGRRWGGTGCAFQECDRPLMDHRHAAGEWALPRTERWRRVARRAWNRFRTREY